MTFGRLVIEGCVVVGLLVAGCHRCDSSVAQKPTTTEASAQPQPAKAVEAAKPPAPPAVAPAPAKTVEAAKPPVPPATAPKPAEKFVLRVDCGASESYKDKAGNVWSADQELGTGKTWGADGGMTLDREGVGITGTDLVRIYETERYSMGSYQFTVPNGKYTVRLHFAETFEGIQGPQERVFSVSVPGQPLLKDLDLFKTVGFLKPLVKEYKGVSVENGQLVIGFTPNIENPQICGIEILQE
jgi:hypothetical protein